MECQTEALAAALSVTPAVYYENESRLLMGERLQRSHILHHSSALRPLIIKAAIYFLRHFCWEAEYSECERSGRKRRKAN